ncbi:carbohydrate ABC transporter permease [Microbacterium sp. NRRL B-14842]|uniref:carbohydrate ABC transporter permease n=1 Tax=Microbacterium sp. NRRL B-14842 TaxID=3162881 RepID=UPI00351958C8
MTTSPSRHRFGHAAGTVMLGLAVAAIIAPFVFAVVVALRPSEDFARDPLGLPTRLTLDNMVQTFVRMDYLTGFANTLVILVGAAALVIVLGALASYPLSRITRRWTAAVYRYFVLGTSVPIYVLMAPLFLLVRDLHILGSHLSVILIYTAMNLPVAIFFYTSFLRQVPRELEEAAALDGAGPYRTFAIVVFPLLAPVTATLGTYLSLAIWNDLLIPIVFLRGASSGTIMGNAFALIDPNTVEPSTLFPAALLGVLPLVLVFALLQKYVVAGISAGAVKS